LAEMCLHRTRADQVEHTYSRLIEIAPTPAALAEQEDDARQALSSLGLGWRVGIILRLARALVERYGGSVPSGGDDLQSLPGVGDYVAQAVLCFGFGRSEVLLDTNTQRIVSRVAGSSVLAKRWQMRLDLYRLAGPAGADSDFNHALLDL